MTHDDVTALAALVAAAAEDADFAGLGIQITRVEMFRMADGSGRLAALLHVEDEVCDEARLRVVLPATAGEGTPGWVFDRGLDQRPEIDWLDPHPAGVAL